MKDTTARNQVDNLESQVSRLRERIWDISNRLDSLIEYLGLTLKHQPQATLIVKKEKKT